MSHSSDMMRFTIRRSSLSTENVLLFLLPATMGFRVNLVGQLMISDLLVVFVFGVMLLRRMLRLKLPYLKLLMGMYLLWFGGTVFSDLINHTSLVNMIRGWSRVGLFGLFLFVIFNLIKARRDRFVTAMLGLAVGNFFTVMLVTVNVIGGPLTGPLWRYGFGFGLTVILVLILGALRFNRRSRGLMVLLLSPVHLLLSARSLFLRTFVAAVFSVLSFKVRSRRGRTMAGIVLLVILSFGLGLGEIIYGKIVSSGVLGDEALRKYQIQSMGGEGNLLLGGRSESLISLVAIRDKPIWGHGSWAYDEKYMTLYRTLLEQRGLLANLSSDASRIPAHSVLLGSWVENGIGGAIFWAGVAILALKAVVQGVLGPKPADFLLFLAIVTLLWDISFSPFGAERRVMLPIFIAGVSIVLNDQSRRRRETVL